MTAPVLALSLILASAVLVWLLSLYLKDSSIADIFWAPSFAIVAWTAFSQVQTLSLRAVFALILINAWVLRLAGHIYARHRGEDHRYTAMRIQHGQTWWWRSLGQVFVLQALLAWFIAFPLQFAVVPYTPLGPLDYSGFAFALAGLLIEAVADVQLARFRAAPANAGKVMDRGLWAWSRHPNYFGDALMWWGYFLVGLSASHAWWTVLCPLTMTFLLLRVSGVSLLEASIADRRPGYADYIRRTSAFVPLPPRRPKEESAAP